MLQNFVINFHPLLAQLQNMTLEKNKSSVVRFSGYKNRLMYPDTTINLRIVIHC